MWWKVAPTLLGGLAVLVTALLDYWWTDRRRREFKRGRGVFLVVVGAGLLLSCWSIYVDARATEAQVQALQEQLRQVRAIATGGESFAYLSFTPVPGADEAGVWLVQHGENPLYNVQVLLHDLARPLPKTLDEASAGAPPLRIPELGQEAIALASHLPLSRSGVQDYTVQIGARNGWLMQAIRMRRVKMNWLVHTAVWREEAPRRILYEKTDRGFPAEAIVKVSE